MEEIKEERDKRVFVARSFRQYETRCAQEDFEKEKRIAEQHFEVGVGVGVGWGWMDGCGGGGECGWV